MLETDNYEKFKKDILQLAGIDLNSYKEKQMRRRINTLITKNNVKTYNDYVALIKKDKEKFDFFGFGNRHHKSIGEKATGRNHFNIYRI